jgi:hypothetical protein
MIEDYANLSDTNPFWLVSSELLGDVFRAELKAIARLFSNYPDLQKFLDAPQATIPQRTTCFELLVHRRIIEIISETLAARYENPLTFNEEETWALSRSANLVRSDAPAWVLEMNEVAEWLPARIHAAQPELLRDHVLYAIDPAKKEAAFRMVAETLGTVDQIQSLIARVSEEQLQRLTGRWSAALPLVHSEGRPHESDGLPAARRALKRKPTRTRDKQRAVRDRLIAEIDDAAETTTEFLQLMDERKVKPQPTWSGWPGSWKQAYKDPVLRRLIHQDKSRALSRAQHHK